MQKPEQASLSKFLKSVGLDHHPFEPLEASADRRLNQHSIEHPVLSDAWARDVCFIVGEPGSGRTTVVEQLLYDCRIGKTGKNNSRKFPVRLTGKELISGKSIQDQTVRAAAVETMLELAYEPWKFEDLGDKDRADLVAALESAAPGILAHFLPQIEKSGSLLPLAEYTDLPASALPGKGDPERVIKMARQIGELSRSESRADKAPPSILDIVPGLLGFDEVKLMADFQTIPRPERLDELDSFRDRLRQAGKEVTLVTLVPPGSNSGGRRYVDGFTTWSKEKLVEVLRARIKYASDENFASLGAISDPSIYHVEDYIVEAVWERERQTPRDVLSLAKTLLELKAESASKKSPLINREVLQTAVKKEFNEA